MQDRFLAAMKKLGFPNDGKPMLVAVSGGVDSIVLATLLHETGHRISVAHCNFQLRGAEAEADETFVRNWCADRNIPFYSKRIDTKKLAEVTNASIQMVARQERYAFFEELMNEHGLVGTALAHHANDRVESLILNVLRGTGFRGLQGMPTKRERYFRPMLGFEKEEIRAYAKSKNVGFREDASNSETYYQRNWVRLCLLPMLHAADPLAFGKLRDFCERAEAELPNYENHVRMALAEFGTENKVSIAKLKKCDLPFTLMKELLEPKGFSSEQVFELLDMLDASSGAELHSQTHRIIKDRDQLLINEMSQSEAPPELIFKTLDRSELSSLKADRNVALLDAGLINTSELQLRKWKQGDRFKPLGMEGWKLLSDFFIDQKLSNLEKEHVWLLTYKGEIVWVVGMRLDDRFKVRPYTQKVLTILTAL